MCMSKTFSRQLPRHAQPVKCVQTQQIFPSMAAADKYFRFGRGCVAWAIKHDCPTHGYIFQLVDVERK